MLGTGSFGLRGHPGWVIFISISYPLTMKLSHEHMRQCPIVQRFDDVLFIVKN